MSKVNAAALVLVQKHLGIDPSKVKFQYSWCPSPDDIYIGKSIKTTYFHSVWTGVVMTLVTMPQIFWETVGKGFVGFLLGFVAFFMNVGVKILGGLFGLCSGIKIDEDSFKDVVAKAAVLKMFGPPPDEDKKD